MVCQNCAIAILLVKNSRVRLYSRDHLAQADLTSKSVLIYPCISSNGATIRYLLQFYVAAGESVMVAHKAPLSDGTRGITELGWKDECWR